MIMLKFISIVIAVLFFYAQDIYAVNDKKNSDTKTNTTSVKKDDSKKIDQKQTKKIKKKKNNDTATLGSFYDPSSNTVFGY